MIKKATNKTKIVFGTTEVPDMMFVVAVSKNKEVGTLIISKLHNGENYGYGETPRSKEDVGETVGVLLFHGKQNIVSLTEELSSELASMKGVPANPAVIQFEKKNKSNIVFSNMQEGNRKNACSVRLRQHNELSESYAVELEFHKKESITSLIRALDTMRVAMDAGDTGENI